MSDYDELMRRLSATVAARQRRVSEAEQRYRQACADARTEREQAAAAAGAAQQRVAAARRLVRQVDGEAEQAWRRAVSRLPQAMAARLAPPAPRRAPQPRAAGEAAVARVSHLVTSAEGLLAAAEKSPPVPGRAYPLLAIAGAVATAIAYAAAQGALFVGHRYAGPVGLVVAAVGQLATFAAPLSGLPALRWYVNRIGAKLDANAVGVVLVAGIAVLGLFSGLPSP